MTEPSPSDRRERRDLQHQIDTLSQRFAELSEQVMGTAGPGPAVAAQSLEELSSAIEELEVAAEELHAQTEALTAAQHELEVVAVRYRELFDLAPDGYLVTDINGVILEANHAATDMLGIRNPSLRYTDRGVRRGHGPAPHPRLHARRSANGPVRSSTSNPAWPPPAFQGSPPRCGSPPPQPSPENNRDGSVGSYRT